VDRVIGVDERRYRFDPFYRLAFLVALFRGGFRVCFNPIFSRNVMTDEMVLWSGAKERVGWNEPSPNMTLAARLRGNWAYMKLIRSRHAGVRHETERAKEYLKAIGIRAARYDLRLRVAHQLVRSARTYIVRQAGCRWPIVGLIPGAGSGLKQWAPGNFLSVMDALARRYENALFVVFGSTADRRLIDGDRNRALQGRLLNMSGKLEVSQLPAYMRCCTLVLGNDTGPMHIAIGVGVPTVCVLSGAQYGRFMPYGDRRVHKYLSRRMSCFNCDWKCRYGDYRCVGAVSPKSVVRACSSLLRLREARPDGPHR
jgi:ADP-heptose:LPS heptosyltransferase